MRRAATVRHKQLLMSYLCAVFRAWPEPFTALGEHSQSLPAFLTRSAQSCQTPCGDEGYLVSGCPSMRFAVAVRDGLFRNLLHAKLLPEI